MKKVIGLALSLVLTVQTVGVFGNSVMAASKHTHSWTTIYAGIGNGSKHQSTKKCKTCGYVSSVRQVNHQKGTALSYSQCDASKHYVTYKCKTSGCGETFTATANHNWKTLSPRDKDATSHEVVKQCKYCNATKTEVKSHSYSGGVCRCGRIKPEGRPATKKKGSGMCTLISRPLGLGDAWVYPKCPKCNSASCTWVRDKEMGSLPKSFTLRTVVKHQYVRCNNCGKEYTNKCFTVVE